MQNTKSAHRFGAERWFTRQRAPLRSHLSNLADQPEAIVCDPKAGREFEKGIDCERRIVAINPVDGDVPLTRLNANETRNRLPSRSDQEAHAPNPTPGKLAVQRRPNAHDQSCCVASILRVGGRLGMRPDAP
jgi:hypothetical protein